LELCSHAGVGDTLLQSWDGISASQALGKPKAVTKLVGKDCVCLDHADLAEFLLDKEKLIDEVPLFMLEYPEMKKQLADKLLEQKVPFPIRFASQMKMSVPNRGIPPNGLCRDEDVTFRATKKHLGKPWYDTIRYNYVMPDSQGVEKEHLAYGRCVCFLQDSTGAHSVILRCYSPYVAAVAVGGKAPASHVPDTFDHVAQLVPLHLAAVGELYSYIWVKVEAIVNGGFVLADPLVPNKYWVQQGHRESRIFQEFSGGKLPAQGGAG
jgi:hypothetical protein